MFVFIIQFSSSSITVLKKNNSYLNCRQKIRKITTFIPNLSKLTSLDLIYIFLVKRTCIFEIIDVFLIYQEKVCVHIKIRFMKLGMLLFDIITIYKYCKLLHFQTRFCNFNLLSDLYVFFLKECVHNKICFMKSKILLF